jgi:hypothetical protein
MFTTLERKPRASFLQKSAKLPEFFWRGVETLRGDVAGMCTEINLKEK